jgi:RNA polymerase sigma-70 factor (ECF subfamily)
MTSATLPALAPTAAILDGRVRGAVDRNFDALWRFLRRLGVPEAQVEDAAQQVFLVFARRAAEVEDDAERSFLFGTAIRVASEHRRKNRGGNEVTDLEAVRHHADPRPSAELLLEESELRRELDRILDELAPEHRAVFVLAELEELTMIEIARLLSIPAGTVASRLRRAREIVEAKAAGLRAEKGSFR